MTNFFTPYIDKTQKALINERAVRAAAGIFLMFGMIAFMNAWLVGNFTPIKIMVVAFLIDFIVRIFIHPQYAPAMIIAQWAVRKQTPEYVSLLPKKFAWSIGLVLAIIMFFTMVIGQTVGPINLITCALCLIFLWLETSFGFCVGCRLYHFITKQPLENCPGGVCHFTPQAKPSVSRQKGLILFGFSVFIVGMSYFLHHSGVQTKANGRVNVLATQAPCVVPEFAKRIGHEEMWKKHNNCL